MADRGTLTATVVASGMGVWILFSPAEAGAAFGRLPAILGYAIGSAIPLALFVPALGLTESGPASVALFLVLDEAFPGWVTLAIVVLAMLLVTSWADTVFNAIASVVTADLARLQDDPDQRTLWIGARSLTVAVGLGAIVIGVQGYSVLTLFLTADLLAAAVFVPFRAGLYTGRLSGGGAVVAGLAGIATSVSFFPLLRAPLERVPGFAGVLPAPSFLVAFVGATAVATIGTLIATAFGRASVDLDGLDRSVRTLDDPVTDGDVDASTPEGRR